MGFDSRAARFGWNRLIFPSPVGACYRFFSGYMHLWFYSFCFKLHCWFIGNKIVRQEKKLRVETYRSVYFGGSCFLVVI